MIAKQRLSPSAFLLSYGFLIAIVVMVAIFSLYSPNFFSLKNALFILHAAAPSMILATGVAFVLMTGKIDISIGSTAYLSAAIGVMLMRGLHVNPILAMLIVLPIGAFLGAINGFVVVVLKVNPLIATLGSYFTFRGLALQVSNSMTISIPAQLGNLGSLRIGPVFVDILFAAFVLAIFQLIHTRTVFGRHVMAVGNGAEVAQKVGIPVDRISFLTFALAGLMASIGGALTMFQVSSLSPTLGQGYEFTAIALLVIGGVSLFGGEGTIFPGIVLGAMALTIIQSGLNFIGASVFVYPLVRGGIIFIAMYADSLKNMSKRQVKVLAEQG
jgi:ribose/xylose/arabinose/galactoside ABC-type transport system permease subunit